VVDFVDDNLGSNKFTGQKKKVFAFLQTNKFLSVLILMALLTLLSVGWVITYQLASKTSLSKSGVQASGCPKDLSGVFTKSFIDPEKILAIRPLGFTTGRDHILPVDHIGFTFKVNSANEKVPVYAPSQITITQISKHTDYTADGKPFTNASNYMFDFTICPEVTGWSEFVQDLSPQLQNIWDQAKKQHDEGPLNQGARAVNDSTRISYTAKSGELIGYTSAQPSLALSIFDRRYKRTDLDFSYYIDSDRRAFAVCPTDLYSGELKKILTDKYGYYEDRQGLTPGFTPRTIEPRCGQIIQDLAGTLQGDWFANRPKQGENLESEGKTISFIHNNYDPTIGMISIGGNITPNPQTFSFKPAHKITVNREFSETRTGEVYCYKNDSTLGAFIFAPSNNDNRVLVELLDVHHLKIEVQSGDCGGNPEFVNPFNYER
jgi:hypothetical protein